MKIKFLKNYLSYKIDQVEEIDATDAADLVAKGIASEVKEDPTAVLMAAVEAKVSEVATEAYKRGAAEAKAELADAFKARKPSIVVGDPNVTKDPKWGFKSFGHYGSAVVKACQSGKVDERLTLIEKAQKATGASEGSNADGGYAVPQVFADYIWNDLRSGANLFPLVSNFPIETGNILNIPADNTTTEGAQKPSGGWISADGVAITPSKPALRTVQLQPKKYAVLVAATDELLNDNNVALDKFFEQRAIYDIQFDVSKAIVRGTGGTQPTGIINHAATVNVGRKTVNLVQIDDLAAMYGRFYGDFQSAVWLVHYEVFPQLIKMTSGNYNVFLGQSNVGGMLTPTIFGIPMIKCEHCGGLGSTGDLMLVDTKKYVSATVGGVNGAVSTHLYFNTDEQAFRWTFRMDGKPGRAAVLTPEQGTNTLSPFVQLSSGT